ncbi:PKD domain protein [Moorella thermoacetica]|uniref:PKD domain protein n=1 Tax=Neomoorella thermoacetica TaxID=1525 RepID=A0A1J5NMB3_NEOTH|nr:PKD domain protein [Moorella thermoacetica]
MMLAESKFASEGRVGAGKMIILVTDAPFHEPENGRYAQDEGASLGSQNIVANIIGYDSGQAGRLLSRTRGKFYYLSNGIKAAYDDILTQIGLNNWPQITSVSWIPSNPFVGNPVTFTATATDADGDPLVYVWTAKKPNGQQIQLGQGSTVTFTPDQPGTWEIVVTIHDPYGALASATRTLSVAAYELSASLQPNPAMRGQKVRVYAALTLPASPSAAQYSGYRSSPYDEVLDAESAAVTKGGFYGYSPDGKVVWMSSGWLECRFTRSATAVYIQFNGSDFNDGYAKVYVDGTYYGSFQTLNKGHNYVRVGNLPAGAHTVRVENSGGHLQVDFFGAASEPAEGTRSPADSIYVVLPNGQQLGMSWDAALQRYWCEFVVPDGGSPGTWPGDGVYTVKVRAAKYGVTKEVSLPLTVQGNIKEKMYIRTLEW